MDYSYLDKPCYQEIPLMDESRMDSDHGAAGFSIRQYEAKADAKLHRHCYIQINYVCGGQGSHQINQKKITVSKGDIFIIPPFVPHAIYGDCSTPLKIIEFEFKTDFLLSEDRDSYLDFAYLTPFMVMEEEVKPRFKLSDRMQRTAENLLREVLEEYTHKKPGYVLLSKAMLLKLLVLTGREYTGTIRGTETEKMLNKYKNVVEMCRAFINENYQRDLSLHDVASAVNYSDSYFSYLFKVVTGCSFVEYLNGIRIEKAAELLQTTNKPVLEIAMEVGFNTLANFNKNFKHFKNCTPREYR